MAILSIVSGLKVEIIVDGEPLQEYGIDEDEEIPSHTVCKYVQAVSGAIFEIRAVFNKPFKFSKHDVDMKVYLDGDYMQGRPTKKRNLFGQEGITAQGKTLFDGKEWARQKYTFTALAIDDGDVRKISGEMKNRIDAMGEIKVEFHSVKMGRRVKRSITGRSAETPQESVPEKALKGKALSHKASLQAPSSTRKSSTYHPTYIDPARVPFATFYFRYRSQDALKALRIIPRTPSPTPLEDKPLDNLTPQEMRELVRRQRERDAAARDIKQEPKRGRYDYEAMGGIDDDDDEVCFIEHRPMKVPRLSQHHIAGAIDLTED